MASGGARSTSRIAASRRGLIGNSSGLQWTTSTVRRDCGCASAGHTEVARASVSVAIRHSRPSGKPDMVDFDTSTGRFYRFADCSQPSTACRLSGLAFQLRRPFEGPAWCRYHPVFKAAMPIKPLPRHSIPFYCVAVAIQLALTLPAAAQTAAVFQGTVVDPSGAVVPSASVRIQHRANGTARGVVTDARGHFEIVALAAGEYRIEVQAPGFQTQTVDPFVVDTGRTIVQDFHLTIGDLSQTVTVDADPPLDRASTAVGHVLNEEFVQGVPLNGRRFVDLGFVLPGSMSPGQGGYLTAASRGDGFYAFNTAGNREDTVNFLVNGVTINEQFNGVPLLTSISTTQEMRIDTRRSARNTAGNPDPLSAS